MNYNVEYALESPSLKPENIWRCITPVLVGPKAPTPFSQIAIAQI
jgi:hypothetical protein